MKYLITILLLICPTFAHAQKVTALTSDASPTSDDLVMTVNDPNGTPANRKVSLSAVMPLSGVTDNGTVISLTTSSDNMGIGTTTAPTKLTVAGTVTATAFLGDGSQLSGVTTSTGVNWGQIGGLKTAENWESSSNYLTSNAINWQGLQQIQRRDINWQSANLYVDGTNIGIGTAVTNHRLTIDQIGTTTNTVRGISMTTTSSTLLDNSSYTGTDEAFDNLWEAIKFTPTQTGTGLYSEMCVRMKIAGTQTTFDKQFGIRIYTDSAGSPGTTVTNSSEAFPKWGVLSTSYAEVCQALSASVTLTSGTSYWAVVKKYAQPSQVVSLDSAVSGTNTHAYSADGTTWTLESNKDGYVKLYAAAPPAIVVNQTGSLSSGISSTNYMTTAVNGATTYGSQVFTATLGSNGQGYLANAHFGTGANMISNYGTAYAGSSIEGRIANFSQTGSLTYDTMAPNVYIARSNTLGAFAHRGPMLRIEDTTASTGHLLEIVKANVPKLITNSTGNTTLGGNLTVTDTTSLGSEKVTNGTFTGSAASWTLGAGWAYNSNDVVHTAGSTADMSQTIGAVAGETYLITLTLANLSNVNASLEGKLTTTLGGVVAGIWQDSSSGSAYFPFTINYIVTATTTGDLIFTPDTNFNGRVDTVSVKKITSGNILAVGNVGIGSNNPGAKLVVVGSGATSSTTSFQVRDSSYANKFIINDAGNVGIGTATPGQALDIFSGSIRDIGIGTTIPQQLCRKSDGTFGYFDGAWAGTCN